MIKLSIVIITKNEARNIERCIKSCLPLKAEIIVLDSKSADGTVAIAKSLGATVHTVDWQGYGATKNHGAKLAAYDWVLSLDADEAINDGLQKSILERIELEGEVSAYWLKRSLVFLNKPLHFGAVRNETRLRLYNKNELQWNLKSVHEDLVPKKKVNTAYGELQGSLLHYSYTDLADMKSRLDKYAQLSAKELKSKSKLSLSIKRIFNPMISFIKNYIINMGFVDGKLGYVFAREQAHYVRKKYRYALDNKN